MDYNHLLSPDALFSPSKAAQQRAQAHDWQHVESWLSALYPGQRLPAFERNEETLKALMAVAAANERADDEAKLLEALEHELCDELDATSIQDGENTTETNSLITAIESSLSPTGLRALDFLSRLTSSLQTPTYSPQTLAHALIAQSSQRASLDTHSTALSHLGRQLADTLHDLHRTHDALTADPALLAPNAALPRQTADFARQTKHLVPKLREYEERLAVLASNSPWGAPAGTAATRPSTAGSTASTGSNLGAPASPTLSRRQLHTTAKSSPPASTATSSVADPAAPTGTHLLSSPLNPFSASSLEALLAQTQDLEALRTRVERLEQQVRAFKDLPADRDEARRVVRARENQLAQLRAERDGAFEGLVG